MATSPKSKRLSLRIDPIKKQKIEQASEAVMLSDRDRDLFFAAILNPPAPNPALQEAFALHRRFAESDV